MSCVGRLDVVSVSLNVAKMSPLTSNFETIFFDVTHDERTIYGKPSGDASAVCDQKLPFWQSKTGKTREKPVLEHAQFGLTSILYRGFEIEPGPDVVCIGAVPSLNLM